MGYNAQTAIAEAKKFLGRATYSMQWDLRDGTAADGTIYFDCSGFVYDILAKAGAWDRSYLKRTHYTGTLKADLLAAGWKEVDGNHVSAGDVFVWGSNYGQGAGGVSHTGIFTDNGVNIIDASWYTAGAFNGAINVHNHNDYWVLDSRPEYHFFHFTGQQGGGTPAPVNPVVPKTYNDKWRAIGGAFNFSKTVFTVDEVKQVNGLWQAKCLAIVNGVASDFDWTDNGMALAIMHRTDGGDNNNVGKGAKIAFDAGWDRGTIDFYNDKAGANGYVGINFPGYGTIWFDSKFAYEK